MADEEDLEQEPADEEDEDLEGEDDESSEEGGKRRLFIVIAAVLLIAIGGFAAAYFTGLLDPILAMFLGDEKVTETQEAPTQAMEKKAVFFPLEELIVNLNTGGRKSSFLKIKVSLELAKSDDIKRIERVMPRILDNFQVYLRELRIEDLKGSAGMYRLREELLARVNAAAAPAKVNDILFKEMLVQ